MKDKYLPKTSLSFTFDLLNKMYAQSLPNSHIPPALIYNYCLQLLPS